MARQLDPIAGVVANRSSAYGVWRAPRSDQVGIPCDGSRAAAAAAATNPTRGDLVGLCEPHVPHGLLTRSTPQTEAIVLHAALGSADSAGLAVGRCRGSVTCPLGT